MQIANCFNLHFVRLLWDDDASRLQTQKDRWIRTEMLPRQRVSDCWMNAINSAASLRNLSSPPRKIERSCGRPTTERHNELVSGDQSDPICNFHFSIFNLQFPTTYFPLSRST